MALALVGIGFEDNPVATLILGAVVLVVAFVCSCWAYKREGK